MPKFQIVNDNAHPQSCALGWSRVSNYHKIVKFNGRRYGLEKQQFMLSKRERFLRVLGAVFAILFSCCLALCSKEVRNLFKVFKAKRFGVLIDKNEVANEVPSEADKLRMQQAREELSEMYQKYSEAYQQENSYVKNISATLARLFYEFENENSAVSNVLPDTRLACLLLPFDEHSKAVFAPDVNFLSNPKCDPSGQDFEFIKKTLACAFAAGKEIVAIRVTNTVHTAVAAFRVDGKFKVIDSLSSHTIDINYLTKKLNCSQLKDSKGQIVNFHGRYINTHLQKGGHECLRFATLYAYQIAKRQKLNAYREVNGAFAEGRLNTFEDIAMIDEAKPIQDASKISKSKYKHFMQSWAYRSGGLKVDEWQDLTFADLLENVSTKMNFFDYEKKFSEVKPVSNVFVITSSQCHCYRTRNDVEKIIQKNINNIGRFEPIILNDCSQLKLASIVPQNQKDKILIIITPDKDVVINKIHEN